MANTLARGLAAAAAMAAAFAWTAPARASDQVVVELFTSQGCSSCPPADALLAELADRTDVIALSIHVDYWDYLGWRDIYARPENTSRQVAYRDRAGARSIYTPQMIVQGQEALVGSRRAEVLAAIEAARAAQVGAEVGLAVEGDALKVSLTPSGGEPRKCVVWIVAFDSPPALSIRRGENAGLEVRYRNVVRGWMKMGRWDGVTAASFTAPLPEGAEGVAVILQEGGVGPVVGAAAIRF